LEEEQRRAHPEGGHGGEEQRVPLVPVELHALIGGDAVEQLKAKVEHEQLLQPFLHGRSLAAGSKCSARAGASTGAASPPGVCQGRVAPAVRQRAVGAPRMAPSLLSALRTSSSCLSTSDSVWRTVAASSSRTPRAQSPRAQSSDSAMLGAFLSSSLRSPAMKRATWNRRRSSRSGTLSAMISASLSALGKSTHRW